jgi:hypothetical protein
MFGLVQFQDDIVQLFAPMAGSMTRYLWSVTTRSHGGVIVRIYYFYHSFATLLGPNQLLSIL